MDSIKNKIISWLKEYSKASEITTFVVGVSGGVDSALTSTLCAETGIDTIVVSMPIHQQESQLTRAHNHVDWLLSRYDNVSYVEKNLTSVFDCFRELFSQKSDLALANSRARIRMTTLYQIAQTNNALVVGTGNKVEDFGVGFYTKYGDGGVDISPIADLMKTEVRSLAGHMGVVKEIINAPPTDGLWGDNRTDEQQLGATYEELEWAMTRVETQDLNLSKREKQVVEIYNKFNKANRHKMMPIPVCQINTRNNKQ